VVRTTALEVGPRNAEEEDRSRRRPNGTLCYEEREACPRTGVHAKVPHRFISATTFGPVRSVVREWNFQKPTPPLGIRCCTTAFD